MAIIRPPVTGNMSLDAWMDQVTKQVSLASQTADAVATAQALTSGVNPVNAVTLVLYKRYTANTLPVSEEISVETVYEYSSGTLTTSDTQSTTDFSGWSRAIPDISNGDYLYACQVNIADTAPTETIAATDWSTPVLIAAANTEGLDGFNNATVTLYQRTNSATAPADPLGTLTYTFATGSYTRTVTTDGWVDINNVGSGDYLWIATAGATSRAATHDIATTEWTVSGLSVNGVDGIDGTNGRSSAVLLIYKRATTTPTAPTGGSFNFGTSTLIAPAEWSNSIPTGDDPVYVSQGIASVIGQSGTDSSIAWDQPKLAFQNGSDGQDGQDGATGKSLFEGFIFKRSATTPAAPVGGQFNFTTNELTPPPGWFVDIPDGNDPAWLATGLFSVDGDTGIDNTVTWSTPTKSFDNGIDGTDGTDGLSVYQFNVFRRASSTPTTPTGGSYDFTNNSAVAPTGWSTTIPSGSDPVYVSTTTASISGPTGSDTTLTWTAPIELVRNGIDGIDGTEGKSTALLSVYKRSASTLTEAPTGGSFNFGTSLLTAPTGWSSNVPDGNDPVYVAQGIASVIGQTGIDSSIPWGTPVRVFQNGSDGIDGSDGSDGGDGKSLFEGLIFKRSATEPSAPTGGSFDFGTNTLTPPSGWYIDIPTGSEPVWLSTGLFEVTGTTGVDNTVTWSTPTKSFQDGADGIGVDGNSVYQFSVFKRSATNPGAPTGGSFNFTTNTATAPTGWSTTAPTSDGNPLYSSTTIASVSGATGTDSTLTWSTPVVVAVDGEDGANGIDGTNGTDGNPAPRYTTVRLWFEGTEVVPGQPSATITWATSALSGISASWSTTAPTVNATGTTVAWFSDVVFNDNTGAATSTTALGTTPQRSISFDGIVTFSNSNLTDGTTTYDPAGVINNSTTTIDGSKITTGTISTNRIDAASGTFNTANIPDLNADKITAGTINVDRIAANSIDTGKISVGGVETTNIATDAVSNKAVAYNSGFVNLNGSSSTSLVTVISQAITTTGGPVDINFALEHYGPPGGSDRLYVSIYRSDLATPIYDTDYIKISQRYVAGAFTDTPSAGTYTYSIRCWSDLDARSVNRPYLRLLELKR